MSTGPSQDRSAWDFVNKGSRYMLLDNLSKGLEPVLVLLCAKLYAGGEWGFFKYFESVILLLVRLSVAGLDRGVVWIYSRRDGDAVFLRAFSRAVNLAVLLGVFFASLSALQWLGYLPAIGPIAKGSAGGSGLDIACYLAAVPLQAATLIFLQAFLNKKALFPVLLIRNLAVPLMALGPAALLSFTPLKPHGLALPYLLGSLAGVVLSAVFFFRVYPVTLKDWALGAWIPRDLLKFSLPLASTDFLMSFAYRVDILLLGRYAGLAGVEVYAVVVMIANSLRSIRQSFDGIMLSVFSAKSAGPRTGDLAPGQVRAFNYASWLVLTLQLPFLPLSLLFGSEILALVSQAYAGGARILSIALAFNLAITVTSFYSQLITGLGKTWVIPMAQGVFFAFSLGLNLLLIPRMGTEGAAWATGIAALLAGAPCIWAVAKETRTLVVKWEFFLPLFGAAAWFIPVMALDWKLGLALPVKAAAFAVALGAYAFLSRRAWRRFNAATPG